jgi:NitT/TauT family transport system substrate-binding protein
MPINCTRHAPMRRLVHKLLLGLACVLTGIAVQPGASHAQELKPVRFAWNPNPQTPQVDVAIKNGLFKDAGLDVKVIAFPTGREALEALIGGQVDFAYMAEFPMATAALRKQNLRVIADLSRYRGQRVIASGKMLNLTSEKDILGKKIGLTLGTNIEYFTYKLLNRAGGKAQIVNAAPSDLLPALVRGDIDVAVMFPTFFPAARKTLGENYRELISDEYVLHMIISTSAAFLEKEPETAAKFVSALVKADEMIKKDPAAAQDIVLANMKGVMAPDALQSMWKDFDFQVRLEADLLDLLADQAAWIVDRGMVKAEKPSAASLLPYLSGDALKKVAPDRVKLP